MRTFGLLILLGCVFITLIYWEIPTIKPSSLLPHTSMSMLPSSPLTILNVDSIIQVSTNALTKKEQNAIYRMNETWQKEDDKQLKANELSKLSLYWRDSANNYLAYLYYQNKKGILENSKKSLNFASQLFVNNLLGEDNPALQYWLASNAKVLLQKLLLLEPENDSAKIALGACYIFGNISNNPMEGILPIRDIANREPQNMYAQFILGLGDKKSGQYSKAIDRFTKIITIDPSNIEVGLHLAECYELSQDKSNAIHWYEWVKNNIKGGADASIITAIDQRILILKK